MDEKRLLAVYQAKLTLALIALGELKAVATYAEDTHMHGYVHLMAAPIEFMLQQVSEDIEPPAPPRSPISLWG
jgi:hypothetical protein